MRSLRARVLVAVAVGALLCSLIAVLAAFGTVLGTSARRQSDLASLVGPARLARCTDTPTSWVVEEGVHRIWAFGADGRSRHPEAPPLPASLRDPPRGTSQRAWLGRGIEWRSGVAQRVAEGGPCAILYAHPHHRLIRGANLGRGTLAGLFVGMGLALTLSLAFAVRPTLRRLAHVDQGAARVGGHDFAPIVDAADDEIGRIAGTLNRAHARIVADRQELAARHRVLERHLAGLAHDLRTPLASLHLTLESVSERLDDDARRALGVARLEVAYLEALADNLHQASRLSGGIDVTAGGPMDWTPIVERVGLRFGILGRSSNTIVQIDAPADAVLVAAPPDLAERALANLVHNALVHGGTTVRVRLTADADTFRIVVRDDGPGLDPPDVAELATRRLSALERPDPSRSRRHRGLGLAIANEVADRAGWTMDYATPARGGLVVTIRGPRLRGP
ncbi:MAG: HAMP domain-containing sensor histidine kinase [Myxococcota bacterium]